MDHANLHPHHQLQEYEYAYGGYYSSLLYQPDYNSKVSSTNNMNMNSPGNILECWAPNSRASMCEGLKSSSFCEQSAANEFLLSKMKEEMPDSIPKLSETIYNSENHLPMSNFSSCHHTELQLLATGELYSNTNNFQNYTMKSSSSGSSGRYNNIFSHNLPIINISNSDLDLNLQVVDLLRSPKYDIGATYSQASQNSSTSHGHYFMEEAKNSPTNSSNKNSALGEAITQRKKRASSFIEAKKHRPASQSSCPQLKVRKEKQREKIATLQRLVAPYGKTDTASVLTEAIGYIQFLHDQVQTFSVPYMRSSNCKPIRTIKVSSSEEDGKGQSNRDLSSRGLRLVPLSCASFFDSYNAGI